MVQRRRFLAGTSLLAAGICGCIAGDDNAISIDAFEYELVNNTSERHTFIYAFETTDELEAWHSRSISASDAEFMNLEKIQVSSAVTLHALIDNQPIQGDLQSYDGSDLIMIEYGNRAEPRLIGLSH